LDVFSAAQGEEVVEKIPLGIEKVNLRAEELFDESAPHWGWVEPHEKGTVSTSGRGVIEPDQVSERATPPAGEIRFSLAKSVLFPLSIPPTLSE